MPVLDATDRTIEIVLGAPPAAELDFVVKYDVYTLSQNKRVGKRQHEQLGQTNGTTAVTIMPAPADANHEHELSGFGLVQTNAADVDVTIRYKAGVTTYLYLEHTLSQGDNLRYA